MAKPSLARHDTLSAPSPSSPRSRLRKERNGLAQNGPRASLIQKPTSKLPSKAPPNTKASALRNAALRYPPLIPPKTTSNGAGASTLLATQAVTESGSNLSQSEPVQDLTTIDGSSSSFASPRQLQTPTSTAQKAIQTTSKITKATTKPASSLAPLAQKRAAIHDGLMKGQNTSDMGISSWIGDRYSSNMSRRTSKSLVELERPPTVSSRPVSVASHKSMSSRRRTTKIYVPSLASTLPAQEPQTPSLPPSSSPHSSGSGSNSSSSLRMLLLEKKQAKPVTYKGLEISAPLSQHEARQAQAVSGAGSDAKTSPSMLRSPRYTDLRSSTPPTPVEHLPERSAKPTADAHPRNRAMSEATNRHHQRSASSSTNKWSLFRSNSTQGQAPIRPLISAPSVRFAAAASTFSPTIPSAQPKSRRGATGLKQPSESWKSKLAAKSKSTFNLKQPTSSKQSKLPGPPYRPPRPTEEVHNFRASSSPTNPVVEDGGRIDTYGWQRIKPLPGRGRLSPDDDDVPHPSEGVSSGSVYSSTSETPGEGKVKDADLKARAKKHRNAAYCSLDGEKRKKIWEFPSSKSKQVADWSASKTHKISIKPNAQSAEASLATKSVDIRTMARLTAVTEEEAELDYQREKPLPATPSSSSDTSASVRKQKSQVIRPDIDHKPWWEEQKISPNRLCFDFDGAGEQDPDRNSSLQTQPGSGPQSKGSNSQGSQKSNEGSGGKSSRTDVSEKSTMLTEIARSYVDVQQRDEERERQERYRMKMRGARLGKQMSLPTPVLKQPSLKGEKKYRFSVDEDEIDSRPSTATNSSSSQTSKSTTQKPIEKNKTQVSATASTLTLPESEKVKLRPSPLRLGSTKQNRAMKQTPTGAKESKVKRTLGLPTNLNLTDTKRHDQVRIARELSQQPPFSRSSNLIRHRGEVLVPSNLIHVEHAVSPPSTPQTNTHDRRNPSTSSSSNFWSGDEPETPPTAKEMYHTYLGEARKWREELKDVTGEASESDDILDLYLQRYESDIPPPLPKKSPRRESVHKEVAAATSKSDQREDIRARETATVESAKPTENPFDDRYEDSYDEERGNWEEHERKVRVENILRNIRGRSTYGGPALPLN